MATLTTLALVGCSWPTASPPAGSKSEPQAQREFEGFSQHALPGKRPTRYEVTQWEGRPAVHAESKESVSLFRRQLRIEPADLGSVSFSWRVSALIPAADLTQRDTSDSPVGLVLAFDGDRSKLSVKNRMMFELAQTLTGDPPPYATLMYVWDNRAEPGLVIPSARTDRIRKWVLESGPSNLNVWRDHTRQIADDYRRVFGEEPGALIGVAFMTDSDNTRSEARAWYGPVRLTDRQGQVR